MYSETLKQTEEIRSGVLPARLIAETWFEESQPFYDRIECPRCGQLTDWICECGYEVFEENNPVSWYLDRGGYQAEGTERNVLFTLSPYFTYAEENSLVSADLLKLGDQRAYCPGHSWFEEGKAPYTVYLVSTGEKVLA